VNEADANMAKIPDDVPDDMAVYCCDMEAYPKLSLKK